jgi:LysR family transcriptional regulator, cys regulon transcriptional activator
LKLQQLRYLQEIVDSGMNLSVAAETLHTSQSGISRYVRALEEELGARLLVRHGKRIVGLTDAGREVLSISRRMLLDAERVTRVTQDMAGDVSGDLLIATTHMHARYALPDTIRTFLARWPAVRLSLRQGNPQEIASWVASGAVDLSIASAPHTPFSNTVLLPCYDLHRVILAPAGHPVFAAGELTLARIAFYPMITYDSAFPGRGQIMRRFEAEGLFPHIALSATDADLMKAYVKLGFGIAILGHIAFDARDDKGLRAAEARHLFQPNRIYLSLNIARQMRAYMFDFITLFAPHLTRAVVERLSRGEVWDAPIGDTPGR